MGFDDTAKDYSGNKHHGTIIGNVSFGEGKIGNAASFKSYVKNLNKIYDSKESTNEDYQNAYIIVPNANDLNSEKLSISVWIYNEREQNTTAVTPLSSIASLSELFPAYSIEECLVLNLSSNCYTSDFAEPFRVCKVDGVHKLCDEIPAIPAHAGDIWGLTYFSPSHSGNKYAFDMQLAEDFSPRLYVYPSNEPEVKSGKWYHVVYTYDNSTGTTKVYYNGKEGIGMVDKRGKSVAKNTANTIFKIGYPAVKDGFEFKLLYKPSSLASGSYATDFQFEGQLDELLIYNRILSQAEVLELYNGTEIKRETGAVDLSVRITPATAPTTANKKNTYNLTVTNNSEFTATGVKTYFVVPGKTLVTVDVPKNCTASGRIIECTLADLAAKKNATQSLSMTVWKKGALNVGAAVSANEDDVNLDDNEKSTIISVK